MGHLFSDGLGSYFDSGHFSDFTIVTARRSYRVHKMLLINGSEYFSKLLTSEFKEKHMCTIELEFQDPNDQFETILRFLYSGQISLTKDNATPILAIADRFLIDSLHKKASNFICGILCTTNVLKFLKSSLTFNAQDITDKCIRIVARKFSRFTEEDWRFLPPELFQRLLQEEYLTVQDEFKFYHLVQQYISFHQEMSLEQREKMLACVRFCWMESDQLMSISRDTQSMVPSTLLIDALQAKLLQYEDPERLKTLSNVSVKPRFSFGKIFDFEEDNSVEGLIHWLGTHGLPKGQYKNPHDTGEVTITASSLYKGLESTLVSKTATEVWTADVPASWFCIDLGENRTFIPTHYSLRHGGKHKKDFLRTWDFQGAAVDSKGEWTLLSRHQNDLSFGSGQEFETCTWEIHTDTAYQKFRVLQVGHNESGNNFLVLSGIELFGDLYQFGEKLQE